MPRVLVVDDDPDVRRVVERLLVSQFIEVHLAESALMAMDHLNAMPFDALISDANMPHYSGFDLIQTVRNNRRFQSMGVMMLTGLRERRDIERAIRAGVDDYIVKPIDPALFLHKVQELFVKRPPAANAEVQLPAVSPLNAGLIKCPVRVLSISELGAHLESDWAPTEGTTIQIEMPCFEQIGGETPSLRILSVREIRPQVFEIRTAYQDPTEGFKIKLKQWIHQQQARRGAA